MPPNPVPLLALLAADDDGPTLAAMAQLFGVAVVVVSPYAAWQLRRYLRDRRARQAEAAANAPEVEPAAPPSPDELGEVVARIGAAAAELTAADGPDVVEVEVPVHPTLDGRAVPDAMAAGIIGDAVARSGLEEVPAAARDAAPGGSGTAGGAEGTRVLRLRRRPGD